MAYNYVVTAHRASAVNQCITGNFTGPNDLNLIVGKLSRFEIFKITSSGLKLMRDVTVFGTIVALKLFRPPNERKDLLFMLTNKYNASILECTVDEPNDTIDIITRSWGNIADPSSRKSETGNIVIIDPTCKLIGLRLYDGLFKVISIDSLRKGSELQSFNIRMEEDVVPDITFLHGLSHPTIGFIYKDQNQSNHVKTYEVSLKEKEFSIGPWSKENITIEATLIIPVPKPFGGVIIIANDSILYINGDQEKIIAPPLIKQYPITCYTPIDRNGSRYLLGDLSGRLFCLILEASEYRSADGSLEVKNIKIELLGEISVPECLAYLDNGVVYVGSRLGDSQLIKLNSEPDENNLLIKILEVYTNLGPITDMCLVDLEKQGQGQLVTCSGFGKDGSLRIIRNGIGINEHASIDLEGIKGMWPLKIGIDCKRDSHLVLTFVGSTYIWVLLGDEVESVDLPGFDLHTQTLYCGNTKFGSIIQVTANSIRLIDSEAKTPIHEWFPPEDQTISVVSCDLIQIVCACRNKLYYLRICEDNFEILSKTELENEVACLDIYSSECDQMDLCAIGFWCKICIKIFKLPNFEELHKEELQSEMIPRSILIVRFEDILYLLCALGDGSVYYFHIDILNGRLKNRKKVTLGTQHTILKVFKTHSSTNVFACSDRPTVIYSSNNKLVFSNVNLKEVTHMCPLNSETYPDSLALASNESTLIFGTIDEIQKLHIRTIHINETPYKITYQQSTQTFGLLTSRNDLQDINGLQPRRISASTHAHSTSTAVSMSTGSVKPSGFTRPEVGLEVEIHHFLIIDQHTFEVLHAHQYMLGEHCTCILSTKLGGSEEEYYIVGTCFVNNEEPEPKLGRLIVYQWSSDNKLQQIAELSIKGAPYSLCEFGSKFLVGVNASVNLVELNDRGDLQVECQYVNATMALYVKRIRDFVLMGDLMRSISLFEYKPLQSHFEEVARDFNPAWLTEIEILDDDTFLGAEHGHNLFVCQKDSSAVSDQERQQLQQVGLFHLGDSVNVFQQGSLVVQHPGESSIELKKTILYGTVEGAIGLIVQIDEALFKKLERIQTTLAKVMKSTGRIEHSEWRAFQSDKSSQPALNFVDGDLIETFLDYSREKMEALTKEINKGSGTPMIVEDIVKTIEELSRIH